MKRTHFFISEPAFDRLKELSKLLDLSVGELIRRAVDDFIEKHKKKADRN
jgi:hypothetical protein